jgi:hypothetical protein
MAAPAFNTNLPFVTLQTTGIDPDEPTSCTNGQQISLQEPQDVEMAMGGESQEMYFEESQTDDGCSHEHGTPTLLYKNTILDVMSPWAQKWRRQDIEGGEVFYQPEVSLTVALNQFKVYQSYHSVS